MSSIAYLIGDATNPVGARPIIIAHICNDYGGWGRGFVVALSQRYSQPEEQYRLWHKGKTGRDFGLGRVQFVGVGEGLHVANMVAQHGDSSPDYRAVNYGALEQCLRAVAREAVVLGASMACPRMGCHLGGGKWSEVEPIIESTIVAAGVDVAVYDLPR